MMITKKEFCSKMDHSYLGWICPREIVKQFCDEVLEYGFASICLNPNYVAYASSLLGGRAGVSCVIGFPCGANSAKIKIAEGIEAINNGATDLDVVTNLSMLRNGDDHLLREEYHAIVGAIRDKKPETIIKFIMYSPFGTNPCLTEDETKRVSELIALSGADYIKFCCDPDIIKEHVGNRIKMKFSGTLTFELAMDAVQKGCERIGEDGMVPWLKARGDDFWVNG